MKKKELKAKINDLETDIDSLIKRIKSLEKELGYEYRREWKETQREPLVEGKPITWPRMELVCHHVKPKTVEWKRYTKLPTIKEAQDERKTSGKAGSEED